MGWTFIHDPLPRRGIDAYLQREMTWSSNGRASKVIASTLVGTTWYAAIEVVLEDCTRMVYGMVCLTRNSRAGGFGYKDMDETMGPNAVDCPKRILDLLTPTESEYARQWREACAKQREQKRETTRFIARVSKRSLIETAHELSFRGLRARRFFVMEKRASSLICVPEVGTTVCRIPARHLAGATIIGEG